MGLKFYTDKPIKKFIDVEKMIGEKNPKLLKRLPGFVLRYIKRTIHEEDVNIFLTKTEGFSSYDFCRAVVDAFELGIAVHGLENVPKEGGCIFASNHPLGGMDAMTLVCGLRGHRDDVRFIVNDVLLTLPSLQGMFVGVNKHGKNAAESLQKVDELFGSDKAVFVFPAGLVSRKTKGELRDLEWKKTFISRAKKYDTPVLPIYISGQLSNFFYRFANIRTALGIKANVEMFYLVNELFKKHKETIHITFGKPIPASHFDKSRSDKNWAAWMKDQVYSLKDQIEESR